MQFNGKLQLGKSVYNLVMTVVLITKFVDAGKNKNVSS